MYPIIAELENVIAACQQRAGKKNAHGYLPEIASCIQTMLDQVKTETLASDEERSRLAAGVFRLMSEDMAFVESELGKRILSVIDKYASPSLRR